MILAPPHAGKFQLLILRFSTTNWTVIRTMTETAIFLPNNPLPFSANRTLVSFGMAMYPAEGIHF